MRALTGLGLALGIGIAVAAGTLYLARPEAPLPESASTLAIEADSAERVQLEREWAEARRREDAARADYATATADASELALAPYREGLVEFERLQSELAAMAADDPGRASLDAAVADAKMRFESAYRVYVARITGDREALREALAAAEAERMALEARLAALPAPLPVSVGADGAPAEPAIAITAADTELLAVDRERPLPPVPVPPRTGPSASPAKPVAFASQAVCNVEYWSMAGVPWSAPAAARAAPTTPIGPDGDWSDAAYRLLVGRAQAAIAQLYGPLSAAQQARYDSLWAPLHDAPSAPGHAYFTTLLPLLDEFLRLRAAVGAAELGQQDATLAAAIATALDDEGGVRDALDLGFLQVRQIRDYRERMLQLGRRLQALGDPPNPLAERCAARRRHQDALAALAAPPAGVYVLQKAWRLTPLPQPATRANIGDIVLPEGRRIPANATLQVDFQSATEVLARSVFSGQQAAEKDPATGRFWRPAGGEWRTLFRWTAPPAEIVPGRPIEIEVDVEDAGTWGAVEGAQSFGLSLRIAEFGGPCIDWIAGYSGRDELPRDDFRQRCWPANGTGNRSIGVDHHDGPGRQRLGNRQPGSNRDQPLLWTMPSGEPVPAPALLLRVAVQQAEQIYWYRHDANADARASAWAGDIAGGQGAEPPPDPAAAIVEAVAQRRAVIAEIDRNLDAWRDELARERSALGGRAPTVDEQARLDELDTRILEQGANRQALVDAITGLERGQLVRTRTPWDEREAERFHARIVREARELTYVLHAAASLPRLARMADDGGRLYTATLAQLNDAFRQPDPRPVLRQIAVGVRNHFEGERRHADRDRQAAERRYALPAWTRTAADGAVTVGALLAGGGALIVGSYGVGTGYLDGGPAKAFENAVRTVSQTADVVWGAWQGYTARDPATGQWRGWSGAAENAAIVLATNVIFGQVAQRLHGGRLPPELDTPRPAARRVNDADPHFEAFRSGEQRLADDLAALDQRFPESNRSSPEYAAARADVLQRHEIVARRQRYDEARRQLTAEYEAQIPADARRPDGTVDTAHPGYQAKRAEWQAAMDRLGREHNQGYEQRILEHADALDAAGAPKAAAELRRLIAGGAARRRAESGAELDLSGGLPKSIKSDIDITEFEPGAGRRFAEAMRKRGHHVLEYPDRWVITDTDTTVWKRVAADGDPVGSSSWEARVRLDTWAGSDKFPTPGGVHYTTEGAAGVADPRGAVIANLKKATEAGLGGGGVDLHVVGKSTMKIVEVANKTSPDLAPLAEPGLLAKARAVREHRSPEEAGITTFGASATAKARERAAFLEQSRRLVAQAYARAAQRSAAIDAARRRQLAEALANGQDKLAQHLRWQLAITSGANEAALANLAQQDPALIQRILGAASGTLGADLGPSVPPTPGVGWLWARHWDGRSNAAPAPQPPATIQPTGALSDLGQQCSEAARRLAGPIAALPASSPRRVHLEQLQKLLAAGAEDPVAAMERVRRHTGYELATVLRQVGG